MFTLTAVPVKFVCLLLMFLFSVGWEGWRLVTSRTLPSIVSSAFHFVMAVIMLAMVPKNWWTPFRGLFGMPLLIALMAAGAIWFAVQAFRGGKSCHIHQRWHSAWCSGMFIAMTWHLWAMQMKMSHMMPMKPAGHGGGMGGMGKAPMMPNMEWIAQASRPGHTLWWVALVGLPIMAFLLYAGIRELMAARQREGRMVHIGDAVMYLGMFWMSTGLMLPILPFFKYLAF